MTARPKGDSAVDKLNNYYYKQNIIVLAWPNITEYCGGVQKRYYKTKKQDNAIPGSFDPYFHGRMCLRGIDFTDKLSCSAIAERRKAGTSVIQPGIYRASVDYRGEKCEFSITFPTTDDMITDVGEIRCVLR